MGAQAVRSKLAVPVVVLVCVVGAVACHGSETPPHSYTGNIQGGVLPGNDSAVLAEFVSGVGGWSGMPVWVFGQEVCHWQAKNLKNWFAANGHFLLFKAQKLSGPCGDAPQAENPQKGLIITHYIPAGQFPNHAIYAYPTQSPADLGQQPVAETRQVLCANQPGNGEWGCSTHLATDDGYAAAQATELKSWIGGSGLGNIPTVVGGDFNIAPSSAWIPWLNLYFARWDDGTNGPGPSLGGLPSTTTEGHRLDYIWFDNRVHAGAHGWITDPMPSSDHYLYGAWRENP